VIHWKDNNKRWQSFAHHGRVTTTREKRRWEFEL